MRPLDFARKRGRPIAVAAVIALALVALAIAVRAPTEVAIAQAPIMIPTPSGGPTWADEFDGKAGTAPDPAKWHHDLGGDGWGNDELQNYTSSTDNAALDGQGHLVITGRREPSSSHTCWYGTCEYTSARLNTAGLFAQAYGTFEARIKLPPGGGLLPAFWMLGDDIHDVGWPDSGEIDVVEDPGRPASVVHGGVHGPDHADGADYRLPDGRAFSDDFHTFSISWTPKAIAFGVDGVQYGRQTSTDTGPDRWVYNHPFFIVLNLAIGGNWPGSPDDAHTEFPQQMVIDYVRVYA